MIATESNRADPTGPHSTSANRTSVNTPAADSTAASGTGADPTFLVIGAQKCGTTWLARMVAQHPDVHTPRRKELHFFEDASVYGRGIEWYRSQFAGYSGETAVGEFTPNYLSAVIGEEGREEDAARLVHRHFPDLQLVAMLRHPVERAVSAFFHHIRKGRLHPRDRLREVGDRFGIVDIGFYARHLSRWLDLFDPDRLLVIVYEDAVQHERAATVARVFRHIGVSDAFRPIGLDGQHNVRPRNLELYLSHYFPRLTRRLFSIAPPLRRLDFPAITVSEGEREWLADIYRDDIAELELIIGRRLDSWRGGRWPGHEAGVGGGGDRAR